MNIKKRINVKCCRFMAIFAIRDKVIKTLNRSFKLRKEKYLRNLRVIWLDIKIKIYFKLKFKARGPLHLRFRSTVRHGYTLQVQGLRNMYLDRAKAVIMYFLIDKTKINQLVIKMNIFYNRVTQIQKQGRIVMYRKATQLREVQNQIITGLNSMRQVLIFEKVLQFKFQTVIEMINKLTTSHVHCIKEVAHLYLLLPSYIHTINLVRWYAINRNDG